MKSVSPLLELLNQDLQYVASICLSLGMYNGLGIVQKIESSCKERL